MTEGGDGQSSGTTSTLIGVAICITGNCCISLALNLQKKAHLQLAAKADALATTSSEPNGSSIRSNSRNRTRSVDEQSLLLNTPSKTFGNYSMIGEEDEGEAEGEDGAGESEIPSLNGNGNGNGVDSRNGSVRAKKRVRRPIVKRKSSAGQKPRTDKRYLHSKLWWSGLALLNLGEMGNFIAYAFSPASLVAPLGTVALVANCFLAPLLLKEPFRKQDLLGIALAVLGGITVVWASKSSDKKLFPNEIEAAIATTGFVVYAILSTLAGSALAYASNTKWGDRFVMIDVGICALAGGFTVLSTKALSSFLSLIFLDTFKYLITYPILLVLIATALIQLNFVNKSLQRFESRIVIPCQFCSFSLSAIIGSAVLYRDFDDVEPARFLNFCFGCAMSALGVWVLTRPDHPSPLTTSPQSDPLPPSTPTPSSQTQAQNASLLITPSLRKRLASLPSSSLNSDNRPTLLRARTLSVNLGGSQYLLVGKSPGVGPGLWDGRDARDAREERERDEEWGVDSEDEGVEWEAGDEQLGGQGRARGGGAVVL